MRMRGGRPDGVPLLGVAGALLAVACCAGLPLAGTILGGLTLAAVLGVAGGILLVAGVLAAALLVLRGRRRRGRASPRDRVTR